MTEQQRGRIWGRYIDDVGNPWALQVDAFLATDENRGWGIASSSDFPLPRGWSPRRVVGWDESGRVRSTVVARLDAALWTGEATVFSIEGSDLRLHVITVTGRMEEHRRGPAAPGVRNFFAARQEALEKNPT